mmetsp:Transcript_26473/g.33034  ORF Transcript_26473/g.33034 Transcript_26473/m.33034 type:complete len:193 (+) Transcript_26473:68-646(+)
MGCNPSNLGSACEVPNMENKYKDARLPHPNRENYMNEFEREFFMLVNMMRDNPNSFMPYVRKYATSPLCSNPRACKLVEEKLKATSHLSAVELEKAAADACFVNLTKNLEEDGGDIAGGAVEEYKSQTHRNMKEHEAADVLKKRWQGKSLDIILEFLVCFYAVQANSDKTHTLLSESLVAIGSAFIPHKKAG